MDKEERYYELENLYEGLESLINDLTDEYYKDLLGDIKLEAFGEKEKLEKELQEEHDAEMWQMNADFERSRLWLVLKI